MVATGAAGIFSLPFFFIPFIQQAGIRILTVTLVGVMVALAVAGTWRRPLESFDYRQRQADGEISAIYTLIAWSPSQSQSDLEREAPGTKLSEAQYGGVREGEPNPTLWFGSDELGQDVLSIVLHACRLSISIGLVSTGISLAIGVTIGAIMGYFGGWVDTLLYRLLEIFMSLPVLFILIVAAGVLPRNIYVIMAIIGCFSWTGSARFIRAEFFKLRDQDFVQAAKVMGVPLHSVLFRHMLPNGLTPVLVEASFAVAGAILAEATISYLGFGPTNQPSWGRLLSSAVSEDGAFKWWLAIFPGFAIFMTVFAYNLVGEALRDAIDPKLQKARA